MVRDILIAIHAAVGTLAFAVGVGAIAAVVRARRLRLLGTYVIALVVLAATAAALTGRDWPGLSTLTQAVFAGLVVLAAVMAGVAVRARSLARGRPPSWQRRVVAAVGFTLIALFDGFAIITVPNAGAPGWATAVVAVVAVLLAGAWSNRPSTKPHRSLRTELRKYGKLSNAWERLAGAT